MKDGAKRLQGRIGTAIGVAYTPQNTSAPPTVSVGTPTTPAAAVASVPARRRSLAFRYAEPRAKGAELRRVSRGPHGLGPAAERGQEVRAAGLMGKPTGLLPPGATR